MKAPTHSYKDSVSDAPILTWNGDFPAQLYGTRDHLGSKLNRSKGEGSIKAWG